MVKSTGVVVVVNATGAATSPFRLDDMVKLNWPMTASGFMKICLGWPLKLVIVMVQVLSLYAVWPAGTPLKKALLPSTLGLAFGEPAQSSPVGAL